MIVPLQLKINNSDNEINAVKRNNKVILIYNDDKEFFRKGIEIWDKIIELMDEITTYIFLRLAKIMNYLFMANVHKNTSFVIEDNYIYWHNKIVKFYTLLLMIVLKYH